MMFVFDDLELLMGVVDVVVMVIGDCFVVELVGIEVVGVEVVGIDLLWGD